MEKILYTGFKGKYNSSNKLVELLDGESLYLTNSFKGLRNDIDTIEEVYDKILMFGLDKTLREEIRFEKVAMRERIEIQTKMEIKHYLELAQTNEITYTIADKPTHYLCNDAYYHMMCNMECPVLFVHIPSLKNMSDIFLDKLIEVFNK